MKVEHSTLVSAPAETIFRIYADVAHWHTWDPDTKRATLDGPFAVGSKGKLTPMKGNTVPMLLTEVVSNRLFTVQSKIPLFQMIFEHELHPQAQGIQVIHRVTFSGFLSLLLGPILIKQLNKGLPMTLANLKQLAEKKSSS